MYFVDLLLYLLRMTASRTSALNPSLQKFFPGEVFSAFTAPSFKFIFFTAIKSRTQMPAMPIIEALEFLSKTHGHNNFEFIFKAETDPNWDRQTFAEKIPANASRIYISAPEGIEDSFYNELLAAKFSPAVLTKL
jgi:hypothetical protein